MKKIPFGYCQCGCGQKTKIAVHSDKKYGWIKGQPLKYILGHRAKDTDPIERFWKHVDKKGENECWNWKAARTGQGYGSFSVNYKNTLTHRYSYEIAYGKIPDGLLVCHSCDNPNCVNPNHLFLGTYSDNAIDMVNKGRKPLSIYGAKLTKSDVLQIRELGKQKIPQKDIAKRFNISASVICQILKRQIWKHI